MNKRENLVGLFSSGAYIVPVLYIPIFIQGVLGGAATNSALALLPMMLGSSVSAPLGGRLVNNVSYRTLMLGSGVIFVLGIFLLSTLSVDTSRLTVRFPSNRKPLQKNNSVSHAGWNSPDGCRPTVYWGAKLGLKGSWRL